MSSDLKLLLSEELCQPLVNTADCGRTTMFTSQISQFVTGKNLELPLIFSGYENKVGYESNYYAFNTSKVKYKIIKRYEKFSLVEDLDNKILDLIFIKNVKHITEYLGFSFSNNEKLLDSSKGDIIEKDEIINYSSNFDSDLNMRFGYNLLTLPMLYEGLVFEDGMVISEEVARNLKYETIKNTSITINTNDLLLNIYGDKDEYKSFPNVGEKIKNELLAVRRRINNRDLISYSDISLTDVIKNSDRKFFSSGTVVDIEVYANNEIPDIKCLEQIKKINDKNISIHKDLINDITEYLKNNTKTKKSIDLENYLERQKALINNSEKKWTYNESEYDFLTIEFKILDEVNVEVGSKITNRFGGKGVISAIKPREEMPYNEDGEYADIIVNPMSPFNRITPATNFELELNYIKKEVLKKIDRNDVYSSMETVYNLLLDYNERQADIFLNTINNHYKDEKEIVDKDYDEFIFNTILESLKVEIPPFFNNIDIFKLRDLYNKYKIEPKKWFINGDPIENKMIAGHVYYMILKHQPKQKLSARSMGLVSMTNDPIKPLHPETKLGERYKSTPVRMGEQERLYLNILDSPNLVNNFFNNSSSQRQAMALEILNKGCYKTILNNKDDNLLSIYLSVLNIDVYDETKVLVPELDELLKDF